MAEGPAYRGLTPHQAHSRLRCSGRKGQALETVGGGGARMRALWRDFYRGLVYNHGY